MSTAAETNPAYPPQQQSQQMYPPPPQQAAVYPPAGYAQPGYAAPQQVTVVQVPTTQTTTTTTSTSSNNKRYKKKAALVTGILQILAGSVSAILGIVLLVLHTFYALSWNIWGGVGFFVVTGILGVISKNQNKCMIIAYMVMCIISAVFAGPQIIYDSIAAGHSYQNILGLCGYYEYTVHIRCPNLKAIVALHAISALTALGEMVVAIVASAFCCHGLCSGSTPSQTMVVTYTQPAPAGTTFTMTPVSYPQASAPAGSYPQGQPYVTQGQPPGYTQQQPASQEQPLMQQEKRPLNDA